MPELPEVETVLRTLEGMIKDRRIEDILVLYPKIIEDDIDDFKHKLIGQSFRNFKRRGKYLIFEMDDLALVSHLRMEGKYFYLDGEKPYDKHVHIIFKLDNGKTLQYHDVRKFGRMYLSPIKDKYEIADLGPEPFDRSFNVAYAKRYLADIKRPIKEVLHDQHFVAGIGNIYANEILFASGVHPESICLKLDDEDIQKIVSNTKKILKKAIKAGGTTI
ncbi:MAG: DNA-formamidopyrimidine glycosylase, partial [Erysipelotrichaceae bacterium]|nr:DNA-formamidopyrimidine glycosylase [Erysipelotrichaceae bacterium]